MFYRDIHSAPIALATVLVRSPILAAATFLVGVPVFGGSWHA